MTIATIDNSPEPKQKYPNIKELKKKYDSCAMAAKEIPLAVTRKSKVKQIACMFDSQISQNGDERKPDNLPEAKEQITAPLSPMKSNLVKQKTPVPTPRTKSKVQQISETCSMSEDEFAKLTVKHKVQLYNQFTNEMSQKNLKFGAELLETSAKKPVVRSEVVTEKQASVKHLLAKLEACCDLTQQKMAPLSLQRLCSGTKGMEKFNMKAKLSGKAKEFEDIMQSSKTGICRETRSKSLPRYTNENKGDIKAAAGVIESSHKRNNEEMGYCLPFEANAPPKKIRRTRAERLAPKMYFPSQESKNLFFIWLREREQKQNEKNGEQAKGLLNTNVVQRLEDVIPKLDIEDNSANKQNEKQPTEFKVPELKPRYRKKKPAPAVPATKAINSQDDQLLKDTMSKLEIKDSSSNITSEMDPTAFNPPQPKPRQHIKKLAPPVPKSPANKIQITASLSAELQDNEKSEPGLSLRQKISYSQSQNLLFTWLSDMEQNQNAEENEQAETISNTIIDQRSEDTMKKLANDDKTSNKQNETEPTNFQMLERKPRQRKKRPAPPVPATTNNAINSQASTNTSIKLQAKDDSESSLSLLQKITSDESQADNPKGVSDKDFEFVKPLRPVRKKKFRRALNWQKGEAAEQTTPTTNTTDSDTEFKLAAAKDKVSASTHQNNEELLPTQGSSEELDSDLLREVNSPRKIKSAYTLTAYSPSPSQEEKEEKLNSLKRETFQAWSMATDNFSSSSQEEKNKIKYLKSEALQNSSSAIESSSSSQKETDKINCLKRETPAIKNPTEQQTNSLKQAPAVDVNGMASNMLDSFIDQGFETGSNEIDSSATAPKCFTVKKPDTDLPPEAICPANKEVTENSSCFSLAAKGQQPIQLSYSRPHQQLGIPSITTPLKNRRKSIYDNESRRSSLAMQVIREDQPLDQQKIPPPRSSDVKEQTFFANAAPTADMPADMAGLAVEQTSKFWIKCGYFSLAFDIFYNDSNRIRLLFNIFTQKSYDTKDLSFGIDNFIFPVSGAHEKEKLSKRLTPKSEYSHYWFSTGDLIIPFAGQRISPDKIQHIFEFLKTSAENSGVLQFGIDGVEFSNVRQFWDHSPKFSMDSNYSMLVGLQSGTSNGLEGRSKYAWPHTKPVRVTDLNQANHGDDNFEENNSGRYSLSPFSEKQFEFTASSPIEPCPNQFFRSSDVFAFGYKNDSLDYLFDEEYSTEPPQPVAAPAPVDFNKIKTQQNRVSLKQGNLSTYPNIGQVSCEASDALKATPHYLQHLKSIVTRIIKRHRRNCFNV